jgi:hypothetical protein
MIWTLQTVFGQFFDAMVGQVVDALGSGTRPVNRSSPWDGAPRSGDRGDRPSMPPMRDADGSAGATSSFRPDPARQESGPGPDRFLDDDAVKLVKYAIVSLRRCHERILPGGGGLVLVTGKMTRQGFVAWIIARYLQSEEYREAVAGDRRNEIPHDEKKYLRVSYGVLIRWPREPRDCCDRDNRKLSALRGIERAIAGFKRPPSRPALSASAEEPAAPPVEVAPAGEETLSKAGEIPEQTPDSAAPAAPAPAPVTEAEPVALLPPAPPRRRLKPRPEPEPSPEPPAAEPPRRPGSRPPGKPRRRP